MAKQFRKLEEGAIVGARGSSGEREAAAAWASSSAHSWRWL